MSLLVFFKTKANENEMLLFSHRFLAFLPECDMYISAAAAASSSVIVSIPDDANADKKGKKEKKEKKSKKSKDQKLYANK